MSDVRSVPELDLERYLGLWYEIARKPLRWEDPAASDITAHYALGEDGSIAVDNRCFDEDGAPTRSVGRATPVPGEPGRLKVSFLPKALRWLPFTEGDYWVLKVAPDYSAALVGTPDRGNLWLLARTPEPGPGVREEYLAEATRQGFDLSDLITPVQDGRRVTEDLLEG